LQKVFVVYQLFFLHSVVKPYIIKVNTKGSNRPPW
jgi:hypothetical protein